MIRFAPRYIQHAFALVVSDFLDAYGWRGATPPFGATSVNFNEMTPTRDLLRTAVGNVVYVSFGDEPADTPAEMGGGLWRSEFVFFVDIVAENESIGLALADDLKKRLSGMLGGSRFLRPVDMSTGVPMDYTVEIDDVARSRPEGDWRNRYVVDGTLLVDFVAEEG